MKRLGPPNFRSNYPRFSFHHPDANRNTWRLKYHSPEISMLGEFVWIWPSEIGIFAKMLKMIRRSGVVIRNRAFLVVFFSIFSSSFLSVCIIYNSRFLSHELFQYYFKSLYVSYLTFLYALSEINSIYRNLNHIILAIALTSKITQQSTNVDQINKLWSLMWKCININLNNIVLRLL